MTHSIMLTALGQALPSMLCGKRRPLTQWVFLFLVFSFFQAAPALAQVKCPPWNRNLLVPIDQNGAPAIDLTYRGRPLDRDEAIDLQRRGVDLSRLEPVPNDFWMGGKFPAVDQAPWNYPADGSVLEWDSKIDKPDGTFALRVNTPDPTTGESRTFQLIFDLNIHSWLMRAALMRKLGYPVPSPRWYPKATIKFPDHDKWLAFAGELYDGADASYTRWIVAQDETNLTITVQDVILEPAQIDYLPFHTGRMNCDRIEGRRTMRALVLPMTLPDVPESVNLYAWEVGKIYNRNIQLTGDTFSYFAEDTINDLRWITRKIGALSREDWDQVVEAGHLPADVGALALEKLLARRNHLLEMLELQKSFPKFEYNVRLSVGGVKNGKLIPRVYDGYAVHFSFRDPGDPMSLREIWRLGTLEATGAALRQAGTALSKYLDFAKTDDAAKVLEQKTLADAWQQYQKDPKAPFQRPVRAWGGPLANGGVQFSRSVITGSYYGGEAKLQLVDSIGVTASLGYFEGISGVGGATGRDKVIPGVTANMSLSRNYVHVKPLTCKQTTVDTNSDTSRKQNLSCLIEATPSNIKNRVVNHKDILVPWLMQKMAKNLEKNSAETPSLNEMLGELREGEMFIVTDSVASGIRGSVTIPIPLLLSVDVLGLTRTISPSVNISGGPTYGILRRTTFTRTTTKDGRDSMSIYVQSVDSKTMEIALDFNWFISFLKVSQSWKKSDAVTQAFQLDMPKDDDQDASVKENHIALAVKAVLQKNDTEILKTEFPHYLLRHDSASKINKGKFLFWRWNKLEEAHRVRIQPPADDVGKIDPADYERTLISHRIVNTLGKNYYGFLADLVNFRAPGWGPTSSAGDNPANSPLGAANWRSVGTEAEVTEGKESAPVTILEHHWGGWSIAKKDLFKLFDKVEAKIKPLNLDRPIIRRDEFNMTDSIKLYEVVSTLLLYENGTARIARLFDKSSSIRQVYNVMIDLEGVQKFGKFCAARGLPVTVGNFPFLRSNSGNSYYAKEGNESVDILCVNGWMREVLGLRAKAPDGKWSASDAQKKLAWTTRLIYTLDSNVDLTRVLEWLGTKEYFMQVRVQGFRTKDENGDLAYISDSIGSIDPVEGDGVYKRFASRYGITVNEIYGRYLSEGY